MKMMRGWLIVTVSLGLAACGQKSESAGEPQAMSVEAAKDMAPQGAGGSKLEAPAPAQATSATPSVALPQIAYTRSLGL